MLHSKTLAGTELYTVSNELKSIGLPYFRQEDAEAFLAQVKLRKGELRGRAKVVPISLDQVYMLKVETIAFRFLLDLIQLKNAMESDLLVVKMKNKRYCPIYFRKDIEKDGEKQSSMTGPNSD